MLGNKPVRLPSPGIFIPDNQNVRTLGNFFYCIVYSMCIFSKGWGANEFSFGQSEFFGRLDVTVNSSIKNLSYFLAFSGA